jgi:hypothetical protein
VRAAGATARDRGEELGGRGAVKWIKIYGFGKGKEERRDGFGEKEMILIHGGWSWLRFFGDSGINGGRQIEKLIGEELRRGEAHGVG